MLASSYWERQSLELRLDHKNDKASAARVLAEAIRNQRL